MWFSKQEITQYAVKNGDLLVVEGGAGAGGAAIVHNLNETVGIQNSINLVRDIGKADVRMLYYQLYYLVKSGYIDLACNKATIPHFTKEKLMDIPYVLWNREEQEKIANYLDQRCSKIDEITKEKQNQLNIISDYKKSLIYEYVTGKKEVPQ